MVTIAILPGLKRTTTDANEPAGASYLISTTDALQAVGTRRSQLQLPRARPFALAQTSKLTGGHHWFRGAHSIDSICRQRCQLSKASHVVACTSTLAFRLPLLLEQQEVLIITKEKLGNPQIPSQNP